MQWESTVFTYGGARQPPELAHYGIKGQRWGQRRFQNADGSYTAEGKERYGRSKSSGSTNKKGRYDKAIQDLDNVLDSKDPKVKSAYSEKDRKQLLDYRNKLALKNKSSLRSKGVGKDRSEWKAKDVSDLSDEELRKRNNRLQAEQDYKNRMTPQWKKDAKQWGKEALKAILVTSVVTVLAESFKETLKPVIKKKMKQTFNEASKKTLSSLNSAKKNAAPYVASLFMKNELLKDRFKKG